MSQRENLEEMLDAREQERRLRKVVRESRAAWEQAKLDLSEAHERVENAIREIEQRQGRLPFGDPEETEPIKGRRRKRDQVGQKEPAA